MASIVQQMVVPEEVDVKEVTQTICRVSPSPFALSELALAGSILWNFEFQNMKQVTLMPWTWCTCLITLRNVWSVTNMYAVVYGYSLLAMLIQSATKKWGHWVQGSILSYRSLTTGLLANFKGLLRRSIVCHWSNVFVQRWVFFCTSSGLVFWELLKTSNYCCLHHLQLSSECRPSFWWKSCCRACFRRHKRGYWGKVLCSCFFVSVKGFAMRWLYLGWCSCVELLATLPHSLVFFGSFADAVLSKW